jgi:hypothetical protein
MDNRQLAAENSSTLISELPMSGNGGMGDLGASGYMQMNVHPNPYGNVPPNMNPVPPSAHNSMQPKLSGMSEPEYRLPSRDIPIDTTRYNIDEQTRPNYIPISSRAEMDYLRDVDDDLISTVSVGRGRDKKNGRDWNAIIAELQVPVLVGILFFVFQSVAIDRLIVRYLAFITPIATDGNLNLNGLLAKSAIFAGVYYLCMYAIENV